MGNRLSQLDFLRGIALLGVLMVHVSQDFSSIAYRANSVYFLGRYGVQLFFAVSGFTIMMMYQSYLTKWQSPVKVFYLKRIMRLYPLFFAAAFIYIPFASLYTHFNPDGLQVMDMVRVLTLTGGIDPHLLNAVVPGGWSIIDEIYFYLLFPLMFLAYGRINMLVIGVGLTLANVALVYAAPTLFANREPYLVTDFLFRNILNNIIVFYAGIEAWRQLNNGRSDFLKLWIPFAIAAVAFELFPPALYEQPDGRLGSMFVSALLSAIIFGVIILCFRMPSISNKWVEKFGTVTFTGYIIHFGIIAITEKVVHKLDLTEWAVFEIMFPLITIVTALASYLIVKFTEHIWQDMANGLCARFFSRKDGARAAPVTPAGGATMGAVARD